MNPKKKNMILIGVAALLLIGALALGFRDSLFGGGNEVPTADVKAAMEESAKVADPMPAVPEKSPFTKTPKKVGGN
jgi:hypothetical protein